MEQKNFEIFKNFLASKIARNGVRHLKTPALWIDEINSCQTINELKSVVAAIQREGYQAITYNFSIINRLLNYLEQQNIPIEKVGEEDIRIFLFSTTSKYSIATKKKNYHTVNTFLKFVGKTFRIPTKNLGSTTKRNALLTDEEIKRFKRALREYEFDEFYGARDRIFFNILLYTGARLSEVLQLKKYFIYLKKDYYIIKIISKKNKKERSLLIPKDVLHEDVIQWKRIRYQLGITSSLFFCSKRGTMIQRHYVYTLLKKLFEFANIDKYYVGTHIFRHTVATKIYKKTKDILLVQELLGHSSVQHTLQYIHIDWEHLQEDNNDL